MVCMRIPASAAISVARSGDNSPVLLAPSVSSTSTRDSAPAVHKSLYRQADGIAYGRAPAGNAERRLAEKGRHRVPIEREGSLYIGSACRRESAQFDHLGAAR